MQELYKKFKNPNGTKEWKRSLTSILAFCLVHLQKVSPSRNILWTNKQICFGVYSIFMHVEACFFHLTLYVLKNFQYTSIRSFLCIPLNGYTAIHLTSPGCFRSFAIADNAEINTLFHMPYCTIIFVSKSHRTRHGTRTN